MNTFAHPQSHRFQLPGWTLAAGVLFVLLVAASTTTAAATTKKQVAAASPTAKAPAAAAKAADKDDTLESIGPGDMVRVNVFRNPDLTTEARVADNGTILFPLVGEVPVEGLTPQQAGKRIADKLRNGKFVVNPEVTVALAQVNSRQVSVLGNVHKPGRFPLDAVNSRLTDLLAAAGGVATPGSDLVTIVSLQDGKSKKRDVDLSQMFREGNIAANITLKPGDTVYVHRAPVVYVYGEVQKAGAYRLEPHMTVMQAIAMGGGLTPRGTERGVRIHRRGDNGEVQKLQARLTDPVQTDDVIYVRESLF
jgi:polysaccharide export outer membrane protein